MLAVYLPGKGSRTTAQEGRTCMCNFLHLMVVFMGPLDWQEGKNVVLMSLESYHNVWSFSSL